MSDQQEDAMLVIAAWFKRGNGVFPGMAELAAKLSKMLATEVTEISDPQAVAEKIAKMLCGDMGMFMVYSVDPPAPAKPPAPPPAPPPPWYETIPVFPAKGSRCKANTATLHVYNEPNGWLKNTFTDWREMDVYEKRGTWLKVYPAPAMWVMASECKPL